MLGTLHTCDSILFSLDEMITIMKINFMVTTQCALATKVTRNGDPRHPMEWTLVVLLNYVRGIHALS